MNNPQFLITKYINDNNNNIEELRKKLFEDGIMMKDYIEEGLMLLYHKYELPCTTDLQRECRSLFMDRTTFKIKAYSCHMPLMNKEGLDYMLVHPTDKRVITNCYEGSLLSVFNHNSKWYVSTRRCLNSSDSKFNAEKTHYDMFMDAINIDYSSFEEFTNSLNPDNSYYFVLIHHENKHIINYTKTFGENYTKLCLISILDSNMSTLECNLFANKKAIFYPEVLQSTEEFDTINKTINYDIKPDSEGIIIRITDFHTNKDTIVKLQNINYMFAQVLGSDNNIYKGFIHLYQHDKLFNYFKENKTSPLKKITNPHNTYESFDVISIIDACFKNATSEILELFSLLWSQKDGSRLNPDLYKLLPKEYKDLLFGIRGLYFKKRGKAKYNEVQPADYSFLKQADVYYHLKQLPTETFISLMRMRKLMFNWAKTNPLLSEFTKTTSKSTQLYNKLSSILVNKLFPTLGEDELPPSQNVPMDDTA